MEYKTLKSIQKIPKSASLLPFGGFFFEKMHRYAFWQWLVVLAILLVSDGQDAFQLADRNADGFIDRGEFLLLSRSIQDVIHPLIHVPAENVITPDSPTLLSSLFTSSKEFMTASFNSLLVILVTEIGDKTFFIAAVLAMRHGRLVVYAGAMAALAAMHVLSSLMGFALPSLLPRAYTHFASAVLFLYFGVRLLKDAYEMSGEGPSEELQEVEEELISKKEGAGSVEDDIEDGDGSKSKGLVQQYVRAENLKVFTQALTLTFLAEWGDRSQIATIALAASKNPFGVVVGGLIGHAFCTGLAVIGGRLLAARISEKTVAIVGGILFLAFALHSFLVGPS